MLFRALIVKFSLRPPPASRPPPPAPRSPRRATARSPWAWSAMCTPFPDYTNAGDDVRVVRLSVSMNASDYGTSASGVMVKTFVDRVEEPPWQDGGSGVPNQLASTTDDTPSTARHRCLRDVRGGPGQLGRLHHRLHPRCCSDLTRS